MVFNYKTWNDIIHYTANENKFIHIINVCTYYEHESIRIWHAIHFLRHDAGGLDWRLQTTFSQFSNQFRFSALGGYLC